MLIRLLLLSAFSVSLCLSSIRAEDGYRLWLRYDKITNETIRQAYQNQISFIQFSGEGEILKTAKKELENGLKGLLGEYKKEDKIQKGKSGIIAGVWDQSRLLKGEITASE
ncbi:MAG: hypothetical protein KDD99_25570, partial [Bacteroidetes bacterium]|nr:hypothetical protein [Bacteroidota bacterium]